MASEVNHQLHFLLCPLMAQGHMIPMVDIAKLIAEQGNLVTIVTTPVNAARSKSVLDRAVESGLKIRIVQLKFNPKESGLLQAEDCENVDMLSSLSLIKDFLIATSKLREPLEQVFKELNPQPDCIVSDSTFPWTLDVAQKFNVPRIVFHGFCCFSLLCSNILHKLNVCEKLSSDTELFIIPGLPDRIEITKPQFPWPRHPRSSDVHETRAKIREAEEKSFGVVVNTFEQLEPEYVRRYRVLKGEQKVWCIGPVSLCNESSLDKAERGNKASITENQCLEWLNSWNAGTVIYACLGSLCNLTPAQMKEIGLGLEASNLPFIWVIRGGEGGRKNLEEFDKWILGDGFEERNKQRGFVIRGWAPQVLILSHPAVGGFLTHCGWNSTLEGICAGLPLVTYPLFADQFLNEKLVVNVLKTGVRVGAEVGAVWGEEEKAGVLVNKEDVRNALEILMDDEEEGKMRRERARKLGEMAQAAVEVGGSSDMNLKALIQDITRLVNIRVKADGHVPRGIPVE